MSNKFRLHHLGYGALAEPGKTGIIPESMARAASTKLLGRGWMT